MTVLKRLKQAYDSDRAKIEETGTALSARIRAFNQQPPGKGVPGKEALVAAARALESRYDPHFGGFGHAPKFPRPSTYALLLRYARRSEDPRALKIVTHSLEQMIYGGMYDQIGGGFHRYSTDEKWLVPHFEKMLYDNAQLVSLMVETYQASGDERFKYAAIETVDYVLREMTDPAGGFYSATDADSEGEEGLFFVWDDQEIERILGGERAAWFRVLYLVTKEGNFEGKNILSRSKSVAEFAASLGKSETDFRQELEAAKKDLYDARKKRIAPLLDDKILTAWNGQMIAAMASAGFVFNMEHYIKGAERAAEFVLEHLVHDGKLLRAHRRGKSQHSAVLEDYAFLIDGLLSLFEATGKATWLTRAVELTKDVHLRFRDPESDAYFDTPHDGEPLLVREKSFYDGAQPSGNSVMAQNLVRLGQFTGDNTYTAKADGIFKLFADALARGAAECPKLAAALDFRLDRPKQIVVVTPDNGDDQGLLDVLRHNFLPNRVLIRGTETVLRRLAETGTKLVAGKRPLQDQATAYVCYQETCQKPTADPEEFAQQLKEVDRIEASPL